MLFWALLWRDSAGGIKAVDGQVQMSRLMTLESKELCPAEGPWRDSQNDVADREDGEMRNPWWRKKVTSQGIQWPMEAENGSQPTAGEETETFIVQLQGTASASTWTSWEADSSQNTRWDPSQLTTWLWPCETGSRQTSWANLNLRPTEMWDNKYGVLYMAESVIIGSCSTESWNKRTEYIQRLCLALLLRQLL